MMKNSKGISFALALALGACSGGGALVPQHQGGSTPKVGNATIRLLIPAKTSQAQYVSASTKSLVIHVVSDNGSPLDPAFPDAILNVGTPNCTSGTGGTQTCTYAVSLPVGSVAMTVNAYDQTQTAGTPAAGNVLSTATLTQALTGGGDNIALTLGGVIARATLALSSSSITLGASSSVGVTASAYDAQGNVIVAPGNYSTPINLSIVDSTGRLALASPSISAPGQTINLNYNGAMGLTQATLSGTVGSIATNTLTISYLPQLVKSVPMPTTNDVGAASGIAITPDGSKIVLNVPNTGQTLNNTSSNFALVYSTASNSFTSVIPIGILGSAIYQGVSGNVAISTDGSTAYLPWIAGNMNANGGIATVNVTNGTLTSDTLDGNTTTGPTYYDVAVRPSSTNLFAVGQSVTGINVISTVSGAVTSNIPGFTCAGNKSLGTIVPNCLVVSADGSTLYTTSVSSYNAGSGTYTQSSIGVLNAGTGAVEANIVSSASWPYTSGNFLALGPNSIELSPDGSKVYALSDNNPGATVPSSSDPNTADLGYVSASSRAYTYGGGQNGVYFANDFTVSPDGSAIVIPTNSNAYIVDPATGKVLSTLVGPSQWGGTDMSKVVFVPGTHRFYQEACDPWGSLYSGGSCLFNEYQF